MVVVLIIGVVLAMLSLSVSPNPRTKLRDEATRLATVMQTAQEEAILQGKLFAINIGEDGYAFYEYGLGGMEAITGDEILKPHKLPENIRITKAEVDGPKDEKKIWVSASLPHLVLHSVIRTITGVSRVTLVAI